MLGMTGFAYAATKAIPLDDCTLCIQSNTCYTEACKDCSWCVYCSHYPTADICSNVSLPTPRTTSLTPTTGAGCAIIPGTGGQGGVVLNESSPCLVAPQRVQQCPRDADGNPAEGCSYGLLGAGGLIVPYHNNPWVCREKSDSVIIDGNPPFLFIQCQGYCGECEPYGYTDCKGPTDPPAQYLSSNCTDVCPQYAGQPCENYFGPTSCPTSTPTATWTTVNYGTSCCNDCPYIFCECVGSGCPGGNCGAETGVTEYSATDSPITILDNSTVFSYITVEDDFCIADANVSINITHNYPPDLVIELLSPSGETVVLHNRGEFVAGQPDIIGTYDDTGSARPFESLSKMNYKSTAGVWRLRVSDQVVGDSGVLNSWTLRLKRFEGYSGSTCPPDEPPPPVERGACSWFSTNTGEVKCADTLTREECEAAAAADNSSSSNIYFQANQCCNGEAWPCGDEVIGRCIYTDSFGVKHCYTGETETRCKDPNVNPQTPPAVFEPNVLSCTDGNDWGPPTISSVTPNTGSVDGGTTVTITGTNLKDTVSVKFKTYDYSPTVGGRVYGQVLEATNLVVLSGNSITVDTPANPFDPTNFEDSAFPAKIEVTTLLGSASPTVSFDSFEYIRNGLVINEISPNSGSVLGTGSIGEDRSPYVHILGANFTEDITYTVGGTGPIRYPNFRNTTQPLTLSRGNDLVISMPPWGYEGPQTITLTDSQGRIASAVYNYVGQDCITKRMKSYPNLSGFGWRTSSNPNNYTWPSLDFYNDASIPSGGPREPDKITVGYQSILALKDGAVFIKGGNHYGLFANPFYDSTNGWRRVSPTAIGAVTRWPYTWPDLSSGVTDISSGGRFDVALKDGCVYVFGEDCTDLPNSWINGSCVPLDGPIGNNDSLLPPEAAKSGVTAISAGFYHILAIKDGSVIAWGRGESSTISIGNYRQSVVPDEAKTGDIVAISAGYMHSLALKTNRTVVAWGRFNYGAITDTGVLLSPFLNRNIIKISAGGSYNLALRDDGTVIGWGYNSYGQAAGTSFDGSPIVSGEGEQSAQLILLDGVPLSGVSDISAGDHTAYALKDGKILKWGFVGKYGGDAFGQGASDWPPLNEGTKSGVSKLNYNQFHDFLIYVDSPDCSPTPVCPNTQGLVSIGTDACGCTRWICSPCGVGKHRELVGIDGDGNEIWECKYDCEFCPPLPTCTEPGYVPIPLGTDECGCLRYECRQDATFEGNADLKVNSISCSAGKDVKFNSQVQGRSALELHHLATLQQTAFIQSTDYSPQKYIDDADIQTEKSANNFAVNFDTAWLDAAKRHTYESYPGNANDTVTEYLALLQSFTDATELERNCENITTKIITDPSKITEITDTVYDTTELQKIAAEENGIYKNTSAAELQVNIGLKGSSIDTRSSVTVTETFSNTEMFRNSSANTYGQLDIPIGVTSSGGVDNPINPFCSTISTGESQQAAVKNETVYVWGRSHDGARVGAGMTGVVSVDTGARITMALKDNGTVVGWGDNSVGLCLGTTASGALITSPARATGSQTVKILGVELTNVAQIAVGSVHVAALKKDKSVVVWGSNSLGQTSIPFAASQNVSAISCGEYHTLALKDDTVVGWGTNTYGQCFGTTGNGTAITTAQPAGTPVKILGEGLTGVIAVAGGYGHSVVLKDNGTVVAWGANTQGQCLGTTAGGAAIVTTATGVPVKINGYGLTGVSAIASGSYHTIALKDNGVVAWGDNTKGQCTVPSNAKYDVTHIAAGFYQSMARKLDGTIVSWGSNTYGERDNDIDLVNEVTAPSNSRWSTIANSDNWSAVLKGGQVYAWGIDVIGNPSTKIVNYVPTLAKSGVVAVSGIYDHILALKDNGTVVGWGANTAYGQCLGTTAGGAAILSTPTTAGATVKIEGTELTSVTNIAAGQYHSLALQSNGTVVGWGAGMVNTGTLPQYGQSIVPAAAQSGIIFVAAGVYHSLAVKENGTVVGWGENSNGECFGTTAGGAAITITQPAGTTVRLNGTELTGVTAVAGSNNHSLALKSDGTVVGWGSNTVGQCLGTNLNGSPITTTSLTGGFVKIGGIGLTGVVRISCGGNTNIAVKSDGTVAVWGLTGSGYVGGQLPVSMNSYIVDAKPADNNTNGVLLLKSGSNSVTTTTGSIESYSACMLVGSNLTTIAQDYDPNLYTSNGSSTTRAYMKSAFTIPIDNENLSCVIPKDSWYRIIQKIPTGTPSYEPVIYWNECAANAPIAATGDIQ